MEMPRKFFSPSCCTTGSQISKFTYVPLYTKLDLLVESSYYNWNLAMEFGIERWWNLYCGIDNLQTITDTSLPPIQLDFLLSACSIHTLTDSGNKPQYPKSLKLKNAREWRLGRKCSVKSPKKYKFQMHLWGFHWCRVQKGGFRLRQASCNLAFLLQQPSACSISFRNMLPSCEPFRMDPVTLDEVIYRFFKMWTKLKSI